MDNTQKVQSMAVSCRIGAEWLEKIANGERENPNVLRAVAAGLLLSAEGIDTKEHDTITNALSASRLYFKHLSENTEFVEYWKEQAMLCFAEIEEAQKDNPVETYLKKAFGTD